MAKLVKNTYFDRNGNKKINCYFVHISKKVVKEAGIKDTEEIKVYSEGNKIIIEKQ